MLIPVYVLAKCIYLCCAHGLVLLNYDAEFRWKLFVRQDDCMHIIQSNKSMKVLNWILVYLFSWINDLVTFCFSKSCFDLKEFYREMEMTII